VEVVAAGGQLEGQPAAGRRPLSPSTMDYWPVQVLANMPASMLLLLLWWVQVSMPQGACVQMTCCCCNLCVCSRMGRGRYACVGVCGACIHAHLYVDGFLMVSEALCPCVHQ
jgi:hypothetical protein